MTQKSLIKMQISPIKNQNFVNSLGTYLIEPKWRFWGKNFLYISQKKIWFRVCSVTAEMFEHQNSGENRRKRSEIFFENLRRAYSIRIWFRSKKNSKLSHACVPLTVDLATHASQNRASHYCTIPNRTHGWTILFLDIWQLSTLEFLNVLFWI